MNNPKGQRALPRVWKRYFRLQLDESFFIGKTACVATGFFSAHTSAGRKFFIAPWRRVQTATFVRDARPGGKSSKGLVVAEMDAARERVAQPHSDNNITGPTS